MPVLVYLLFAWTLTGPPDIRQAENFFKTGEKLYAEGKYKLAADTFAVAASLYSQSNKPLDHVRSANMQAECLANISQCEQAGTLLKRSLEIVNAQPGDNRVLLADTYYYLSRYTGGCARKFDEATRLMQRSITIKNEIYKKDDPSVALDYTFLGYIYNSKGKYDSALMYLDRAMSIREKHLNTGDIEMSHTLFNLAASYEGKSELGKALNLNQRSLKIRLDQLGENHATVSNSINSIGRVYRKLGNHERALEYYRKALDIRKNTLGENHPNVAASYYEIGNLYGTISNYHSALEYVQQGNRILENNTQVANDVLPTYIAYAGKLSGLTGQHNHAKALLEKAITMTEKSLPKNHPYRAVVYNVAGEYYGDSGDAAKQSVFFNKAIAVYRSAYGAGSEREGDVVAKMAATCAKMGKEDEALKLYNEALAIFTTKLGVQNPKVTSIYLGIGDLYSDMKNIDAAEKSYQQALASIATRSENKSLELKIARSQAKLSQSLAGYRAALQLADEITQGYNNDAARIQLERDKRDLYAGAMNAVWKLYENGDRSVLSEAFDIAGKSKSTLLLENTRDQQAKTIGGVPDSLLDKERDLRIELSYYKTALHQVEKNKDTATIHSLGKNIFDSERQLERFKAQLERDFPSYFKLKYTRPDIDLPGFQHALPKDVTVAQYFVSDSAVFCLLITNSSVGFRKQYVNLKKVADYRKSLTDLNFILSSPKEAGDLYAAVAKDLCSRLMLSDVTSERLIIIADDFLAQINFGTLQSSDQYLNLKHQVSYAYSAAFLADMSLPKRSPDTFAGFAPSYESDDYVSLDTTTHPLTALVMRSGRLPLPGATEEVNLISQLMNGRSWLNEDATETNFKKHSSEYGVLHLAMHSLLNEEDPRYSELLFNHRKDNDNDGYLTIAEIYNLKLNAQLVVLSSCSSGFGKIQHGEGTISLSRAFSYAGCPSVVMSLWKVPDHVTTGIMKDLYEGLSAGLTKDEALRSAQVKYLERTTDPLYRHPYYWAGFVVIGDTSPLRSQSYLAYFIGGIFVVGLGVLLFVRRK